MMLIPLGADRKFEPMFKQYQYLVNSQNIYLNTIKLVNGKHRLLDRDSFVEYYKNILEDIELKSHPIDLFIPNEDMESELENEEGYTPQIMVVSHESEEYQRISKRITLEDLYATVPETHPVHMELKANPGKLDLVIDDIVLYWCVFKFINMVDAIRLKEISVMTPIIEYTVDNIDIDIWQEYLSQRTKIDEEKVEKWMKDNFFNPDYNHTLEFYSKEDADIQIDINQLFPRLCTNIIFNSDIYIITAVYLILSFSKVDINEQNYEGSKCATYVRDVLSKL